MKLQNLTVVFIIIVLPIILLLSYYIQLQIDTIAIQVTYNTKLIESTKEALDAFEINTVEWNEKYSNVAGSKRRDIYASINTFTTSLSNNLGIGGTDKDLILNYIPGIVYTLYDGYYIYGEESFSLGNQSIKSAKDTASSLRINRAADDDGLLQLNNDILQPFVAYSETIKTGLNRNENLVINYTLDNYVTVYGKDNSKGTSFIKSGYLSFEKRVGFVEFADNHIEVQVKKQDNTSYRVKPEILQEKIKFKKYVSEGKDEEGGGIYKYIYTQDKTKVYYEEETKKFFTISNKGYAYYLNDDITNENEYVYKKIYIYEGLEITSIYQALNGNRYGKWFKENENGVFEETTHQLNVPIYSDISAMNFWVESKQFTKWFNENVKNFSNEAEFVDHKQQIIRSSIEKALERLSLSTSNERIAYKIPQISEQDWDKILSNVSILTFMQGLPIGNKYYNNYAYATSTKNKEFVDENEIYLVDDKGDDEYYHREFCSQIENSENYTGYRNIDFVIKNFTYKVADTDDNETTYYRAHEDLACYQCMVERASYEPVQNETLRDIYETALARERYVTYIKENILIKEEKTPLANVVKIGDYVNYDEGGAGAYTYKVKKLYIRKEYSMSTEDFNWRVLYIKDDGTIVLIGDRFRSQAMFCSNSFNTTDAEELNDICENLYGNGIGVSLARSFNESDAKIIQNKNEYLWIKKYGNGNQAWATRNTICMPKATGNTSIQCYDVFHQTISLTSIWDSNSNYFSRSIDIMPVIELQRDLSRKEGDGTEKNPWSFN